MRPIDADLFKKVLEDEADSHGYDERDSYDMGVYHTYINAIELLDEQPTAEPKLDKKDMPEQGDSTKFGVKTGKTCAYWDSESNFCALHRPSAEPESRREWYMKGYRDAQDAALHESCTDCPLYDHDKHRCPRFNKVIPTTIQEILDTQPEPSIPLSWFDEQIERLKSLDNAFATLTAMQISGMVKKWRDEQDE